MELCYLDTSALAKWYLREPLSEEVEAFLLTLPCGVISSLTRLEMACLLARRRRSGEISPTTEARVTALFEQEIADEHLRMHAVSRLMLRGAIDNIQVSWVKLGPELARRILAAGANDMGGTLMNENISRAAGAPFGQEMTPMQLCRLIRGAGRVPVQRSTTYQILERFDDHDPSHPY